MMSSIKFATSKQTDEINVLQISVVKDLAKVFIMKEHRVYYSHPHLT